MNGFVERFGCKRWLRVGLSVATSLCALAATDASARGWHGYHRHHATVAVVDAYNPAFSAIVVDENTGRELYGVNENALRHPASITKVMTLYLLFEQLDKGAMKLDTPIRISEHAAAQEPSKLGIAAGDSLPVEDAIKAVVTRSANDVAVAIAESIGGDESSFAEMMTRKAHALGMSRTLYRNASGLPNDEQWTTARDLTVLARSLEERFPQYFHYFSTHEFNYDGEIIGNHNHLLGEVAGVDGIKTGYTRASGFNLLTSMHRDGRSLVAVVMGGRSAGARDRAMEALLETHIAEASDRGHTAPVIADNESPVPAPGLAQHRAPPQAPIVSARFERVSADSGEGDNSEDDAAESQVAPPAVKTVPVAPAQKPIATPALVHVALAPAAPAQPSAAKPATPPAAAPKTVAAADPAALGWKKGPEAAASRPVALKPEPDVTRVARADAKESAHGSGWVIQIGAEDDASKANALLERARTRARVLADAKPFTEKFSKRGDTYFRARFSGLTEASATEACKTLHRSGIACFATHIE